MFDVVDGIADVRVDLAQRGHADAHRLQIGVVDIGRDDHPAARHFIANGLRRQGAPGGATYSISSVIRPLAGVMDLRPNFVARALGHPFVSHNALIICENRTPGRFSFAEICLDNWTNNQPAYPLDRKFELDRTRNRRRLPSLL